MAITRAWTDVDDLEFGVDDVLRAPPLNAILGNQAYLHSAPRISIVRNTAWTVASQSDEKLEWNEVLEEVGNWWFPETNTVQVPEDGKYLASFRLRWPQITAASEEGTFRRFRILRSGAPIADQRLPAMSFAAHLASFPVGLAAGRSVSVDLRHDADDPLTLEPVSPPSDDAWLSPILTLQWVAPLTVEV